MVILGWVLDKPLALLFDPFESIVLYISGTCRLYARCLFTDSSEVHTMNYVVADGKSNWLEGLILVCKTTTISVLQAPRIYYLCRSLCRRRRDILVLPR